jgi:hypothetical protein
LRLGLHRANGEYSKALSVIVQFGSIRILLLGGRDIVLSHSVQVASFLLLQESYFS